MEDDNGYYVGILQVSSQCIYSNGAHVNPDIVHGVSGAAVQQHQCPVSVHSSHTIQGYRNRHPEGARCSLCLVPLFISAAGKTIPRSLKRQSLQDRHLTMHS